MTSNGTFNNSSNKIMYTINGFVKDKDILKLIMQKHPHLYLEWFFRNFPNGAKSREAVLYHITNDF